ncbi:MAG: carboxymuconolactone decarboxylase family protein, partial [Chromatiales bacterium]
DVNLFAVMAEAPGLLDAYLKVNEVFANTSLDPREQTVVLITVSRMNGCRYCMAAHSAGADMTEVPAPLTDALRGGEPLDDPRLEALRRLTAEVVERRGWPEEDEVERFLAAGYGRRQLLEVLVGVGLKTLSSYTNHIAGTQLDPPLASRAWSPDRSRTAGAGAA